MNSHMPIYLIDVHTVEIHYTSAIFDFNMFYCIILKCILTGVELTTNKHLFTW